MHEALNDVAGTGNTRYQHYLEQVERFYAEWQAYCTPKVMKNTPLTLEDYNHFPRFQYVEQPLSNLNPRLLLALLGLIVPAALLAWFSARMAARYSVASQG